MQVQFPAPSSTIYVREVKRVRPARHITSNTVLLATANITVRGVDIDGFMITAGPIGLEVNPPLARYIVKGQTRYKQVVELSPSDFNLVRHLVLTAFRKKFI